MATYKLSMLAYDYIPCPTCNGIGLLRSATGTPVRCRCCSGTGVMQNILKRLDNGEIHPSFAKWAEEAEEAVEAAKLQAQADEIIRKRS